MDITPLQCRSPSETDLVELVDMRQKEVERLDRELGALHTHCELLVDSFSIPTYPLDADPVAVAAAVLTDHSNDTHENDTTLPSSHGDENDTVLPSSHGDENVTPSLENDLEPSVEVLSSSSSKGAMDWSHGDDVELLKDLIRRKRPAPANPEPKNSEETGTSSDDNGGSTDEELSSKEASSSEELSSNESDDIELVFRSKGRRIKPIILSDSEEPSSDSERSTKQKPSPAKIEDSKASSSSDSECSTKQKPSSAKIEDPEASSSSHSECSTKQTSSPAKIEDPEASSSSHSECSTKQTSSPAKIEDPEASSSSDSECSTKQTSSPAKIEDPKAAASSDSECSTKQTSSPAKIEDPKVASSSEPECSTKQKPSPAKIEDGKASSSSSDDSEGSSSSSSSSSSDDDNTGRNEFHTQARRPFPVPKVAPTLSLPSDASPEDFFDWMVLGLQGPWLQLAPEHTRSEEKEQPPLPLKFPSTAAYVGVFQKLIGEEARAVLLSEWEQYQAAQDSTSMSATQSSLEYTYSEDPRALSSTWQLRSMVQMLGDPFHYLEADWKAGPKVKFNAGELVCMVVPGTKEVTGVALINNHDRYQAPLLRTRAPWNPSFTTCVLMRLCNMVTLRRMFLAVSTVSEIFAPLRQQILDPAAANTKLPKLAEDDLSSDSLRIFRDRSILNTLQLLTVSCLLQMRQGFHLVQGPPGTGKTSTIVGMVSTLLIEEPGVRILVCAPSNAALDEVAARLLHQMLGKAGTVYSPVMGAVVRFGMRRVMHPLVQMISLESLSLKLSIRSWADILDAASVVCATLSGCGNSTFDELKKKFDVVIIDEAAQAVEPEALIALKRVRGRCVMVGDPQQLPATVFQRPSTPYGCSLFERLQVGGVPVIMLKDQYRMHPSISLYPSQKFYCGALQNAGKTLAMRPIFGPESTTVGGHTFQLTPYTFIDVNWSADHLNSHHSRANVEEALVVCNIIQGVVRGLLPGVKSNVGVITPYLAQRALIREQLGRRGIQAEVDTVDGFQGREKDVVVLSCVRAVADRGVGFVADEKRMNVALTRARFCLVVVGCAATLRRWSPAWAALIDDATRRGCFQVLRNHNSRDKHRKQQGFTPQRGDVEAGRKRKRSSGCANGEQRPHKKKRVHAKPMKAGTERRS